MFGITLHTYRMNGQVCIKFGVIVPFLSIKWSTTKWNFNPAGLGWNTKFNTILTVQTVCAYLSIYTMILCTSIAVHTNLELNEEILLKYS